jgi:hypothetical protein
MKEAPERIKAKLAKIDPWLRLVFDSRAHAWTIIRLHGAPMRGRRSFMPRNRFVKLGGGMYDMQRSGELVSRITGPAGEYVDIVDAWPFVSSWLRERDTWERNIRTGKIAEERDRKNKEAYEREDEEETMDIAHSLGRLTDPFIDMGAKEDRNNPARRHRRDVREGRI